MPWTLQQFLRPWSSPSRWSSGLPGSLGAGWEGIRFFRWKETRSSHCQAENTRRDMVDLRRRIFNGPANLYDSRNEVTPRNQCVSMEIQRKKKPFWLGIRLKVSWNFHHNYSGWTNILYQVIWQNHSTYGVDGNTIHLHTWYPCIYHINYR